MMVRRFDLTLSNKGLRRPASIIPGDGTEGCGGSGGIICTGFGVSRTRTCLTCIGAVGGGGNQGWRRLSESEASLSNFFSCTARAIVPRLRLWFCFSFTGPLVPSTSPRPHLQPSMSLAGAAAEEPLVRFHRHSEVTALKAKSTHRAMLKPQSDLIS